MAIAYGIYYFKNLTSKEEKEENIQKKLEVKIPENLPTERPLNADNEINEPIEANLNVLIKEEAKGNELVVVG